MFFTILTIEMLNDLSDTHHRKPKLAPQTSKALDNLSDNPTNSMNNPTGITPPPPFYTKRPTKLHTSRFKLFSKRQQISQPIITH